MEDLSEQLNDMIAVAYEDQENTMLMTMITDARSEPYAHSITVGNAIQQRATDADQDM